MDTDGSSTLVQAGERCRIDSAGRTSTKEHIDVAKIKQEWEAEYRCLQEQEPEKKSWWHGLIPTEWTALFIVLLVIFWIGLAALDIDNWLGAVWTVVALDALALTFSLRLGLLETGAWSLGALLVVFLLPFLVLVIFCVGAKVNSCMPRWLKPVAIMLGVLVVLGGLYVVLGSGWQLWEYHTNFVWGGERTPGVVPAAHMVVNCGLLIAGLTLTAAGVGAAGAGSDIFEDDVPENTGRAQEEPYGDVSCAACGTEIGTSRLSFCGRCKRAVHRSCLSHRQVPGGRLCKKCSGDPALPP